MQTIGNNPDLVAIKTDDAMSDSVTGNYAAVRFNALKHGVLSRHVVLPHEDRSEFDDLLAALIMEHQPGGATELHLVEELAAILWRKRRVLMAEGARINAGLQSALDSPKSVVSSAAPFQRGLRGGNTDLRGLLDMAPENLVDQIGYYERCQDAANKALAILRRARPNAYEQARKALIADSRDWWDDMVADGKYMATVDGLENFILVSLFSFCYQHIQEAKCTSEIRAQTLGEGMQEHLLEKLNRYETHLDRKFERTLAMLLKLKELRGSGNRAG